MLGAYFFLRMNEISVIAKNLVNCVASGLGQNGKIDRNFDQIVQYCISTLL